MVKQPLYDQLVDVLKTKIETEMEAHDLLPSERELVTLYGVSRTTVRQALQELEHLGYIYRSHGKGTYVSDLNNRATNLLESYSFTQQMRSMGKVPKTKVLSFERVEANKFIASYLQVAIGTPLLKIKRLRLADGEPMMLERTYLPLSLFTSLTLELVETKPLYDIMQQDYKHLIKVAHEEFFASVVRFNEADVLDVPKDSPVLHLTRTTYNAKNQIVEFTLSVARADKFKYKVTHYKD